MQNRYAGDVGDFGKLGLLRSITAAGIRVGVNWYLAPDENHNADGKHTGYLTDKIFRGCDDDLLEQLGNIVHHGERSVLSLEACGLLPGSVYYHEILKSPNEAGTGYRQRWHLQALDVLQECDLVFLDPDNGLLVQSVSPGSAQSVKYILPHELAGYFRAGKSVVFYNHRCREKEEIYLERFRPIYDQYEYAKAKRLAITFKRGTVRDYVFILQESHEPAIARAVERMLAGSWGKHFTKLDI